MAQTNLGPLTTTFVPPTSCVSSYSHIYWSIAGGVYAGPFSTGACLPSNYDNQRYNYYSPGVCPSGFTPACSWTTILGSVTETAVTCCPQFGATTYTCNDYSHIHYDWETTVVCNSAFATLSTAVTVISSGDYLAGQATVITESDGAVNVFGVQVRYQSTDFRTTPPPAPKTTTSTSSGPTSTSASSTGGGDNGLSTGAKAGIGVGVTVVSLVLLGILICLCCRRRRRPPMGSKPSEFSHTPGAA